MALNLQPSDAGLEVDDVTGALELSKGQVQQVCGLDLRGRRYQVRRHVVRGSKRRRQVKGFARDELMHCIERHEWLPDNERCSAGIDSSSTRPACQLRIITRLDHHMACSVVFGESIDHDGTCGHVDPHRECFGREHDLYQSECEATLNDLLEDRNHAGMMCGDPTLQQFGKVRISESCKVVVGERLHCSIRDLPDSLSLLMRGQRHPGFIHLGCRILATTATEHKVDGWESIIFVQEPDHFGPSR